MSVVFIDASGKTLDSTLEPLDFSCTTVPVAISIGFGSTRPEERVYRDGAFLPGYSRSRASAGVFSIVRDQEWPGNPQLYVDEVAAIPSTLWDTLGDFDFTSFATTTPNTAQNDVTVVLGGKTWNVANRNGGAPGQGNVNGSGFRLLISSGGWDTGATQNSSHLSLNLTQLTGYIAARRQAVLALVSWTMTSTLQRIVVGHWKAFNNTANAGTQCISSQSQVATALRYQAAGDARPKLFGANVPDQAPANGQLALIAPSASLSWAFGAVRHSDGYGHGVFGPYVAGAFPAIENVETVGGTDTGYASGDLSGGVAIASNGVGQQTAFVRRMVFLQSQS